MPWVGDNRHGHHSHGDDGEHSNAAQSKAPGCPLRNFLHSGRHSRMPIDLADEAVSALGKGFNVARRLCIVAQCGANLPDGGVKPLFEIYEGFTAADLLLDLLASKNFVRIRGKQSEHFAGLGSEVKESLPLAQFTGLEVELERSEPQKRWVVGRGRHDTSFLRDASIYSRLVKPTRNSRKFLRFSRLPIHKKFSEAAACIH